MSACVIAGGLGDFPVPAMGLNTPACRIEVDGFPIDVDAPPDVLAAMDAEIRARTAGHYISITNTETLYHARRMPELAAYVRGSDFSLCDGIGVVLAARAAGRRVTRFTGPNLQLDASAYGASRGWRHYYIGGTQGSAAEMGRRLQAANPGMIVCGIMNRPSVL